jgi:hypothetical protein
LQIVQKHIVGIRWHNQTNEEKDQSKDQYNPLVDFDFIQEVEIGHGVHDENTDRKCKDHK